MQHLRTGRSITSIEAIGLYGITRLAAVVHTLTSEGVPIISTPKMGVRKRKYASYSL